MIFFFFLFRNNFFWRFNEMKKKCLDSRLQISGQKPFYDPGKMTQRVSDSALPNKEYPEYVGHFLLEFLIKR